MKGDSDPVGISLPQDFEGNLGSAAYERRLFSRILGWSPAAETSHTICKSETNHFLFQGAVWWGA